MKSPKRALTGAALASTLVVVTTSCATDGEASGPDGFEGRGPITYVAGADSTGLVPLIIDDWNQDHPDEQVTFIELPEQPDAQRQQMIQNAQTQADTFTVLSVDVVWTAEFAANGWIDELPRDRFDLDAMMEPVVATGEYQGRLFSVPESSDGAMLYYRTDLLEAAGIDGPPETWAEMTAVCEAVLALPEAADMSCYAGQFEKYEGLTVNFAEAVGSAGGSIVDEGGTVTVDSPEAREGLDFLVGAFDDGLIPREAVTYQEEQGRQAFQDGELVFHRQWPYQYALANAEDGSSEVAGLFDVAPLPGLNGPGTSSLGGHNLAVSAFAENRATALDFIEYFTSEEKQLRALREASLAPAYAHLYDDPSLVEEYPYLPVLRESILNGVPRPRVVRYGDTTAAIQDEAYAALTGDKTAEQALSDLQARLEGLTS
ncbi:ABC transporter substrate-binding protein [Nocardiopsis sp. NPDC050513]|uniref:ABC transporter substrate-binding protein n=1 Tax=Nocardiopsis sp. NPDC050513 TaxID=3364338 RepID=UPI0037BBB7FC